MGVKLVQMPRELLHLEDADLDGAGIEPGLLAAFRVYLPRAVEDRRGLAILTPVGDGGDRLLMVLARRIGAALRDANIRLRDDGGDLKVGRQKLCYLPGGALRSALSVTDARAELARQAACFVQDLDGAWPDGTSDAGVLEPRTVLDLLDERLAAGRPTFLNAAPERLPPGLADDLAIRLPVLMSSSR
jgi:hypothetical protein